MSRNDEYIVGGPWSGAVSDTEATIKVSIKSDIHHVSLVRDINQRPDSADMWIAPTSRWLDSRRDYKNDIYTFKLENLRPGTEYHYALVLNGVVPDNSRGKFKTFPSEGQQVDFTFAFASCSKKHDEPVFKKILEEQGLLFFFHLGDLHYGNLMEAPLKKRLKKYDEALKGTSMGEMFKNLPIAYTWDDHDFLDNNAGGEGNETAAAIAKESYDIYVPHYDFAKDAQGIYQSFTVGKVLFILTDLRFNQSSDDSPAPKTILGKKQKEWLKDKLSKGKEMDLIVMTSSFPYIHSVNRGYKGNWGDCPEERAELANFIKAKSIKNLCMISGDAHMLAIDDGSHSGFANRGRGGFPVFHAAALANHSSTKGGPYSIGDEDNAGTEGDGIGGGGQYGVFRITYTDRNGNRLQTPRVIWRGRRVEERRGNISVRDVIGYEFSANPTYSGF